MMPQETARPRRRLQGATPASSEVATGGEGAESPEVGSGDSKGEKRKVMVKVRVYCSYTMLKQINP